MIQGIVAGSRVLTVPGGGVDYATEVLADSPLAYYRLGEASGTTMVDSSGNGRNGTYTGSPTLGATSLLLGDADTAVSFNGSAQYGGIAWASWQNVGSLTIEAWINTTASGIKSIWDRDDLFVGRPWQFRMNAGKLEFIRITNAAGSISVVTAAGAVSINDGNTHHVAATYDGTTIRLYVDGVADGTASASGGVENPGSSVRLSVGVNHSDGGSGAAFFIGVIDEAAYYGTALSADRVAAHFAAGTPSDPDPDPGPEPSTYTAEVLADAPVAYYRLGEASGTTMVDSSGNGRNGTYSGSVTLASTGLLVGDADTCADFAGGAGTVTFGSWQNQAVFSVEAIFVSDTVSGDRTIACRQGGVGAAWILRQDSGTLHAYLKPSSGGFVTTSVAISAATRYHAVMTYNGASLLLYLNGSLVGTVAAASPDSVSEPVRIGASGFGESFDGRIDEVSYYGTVLSAARVLAHYDAGT